MRAGYGGRGLNENLAPLRRYLRAQLGRPWNKVFGEICQGIDRRNTVQQHIHQHIDDFIAIHVEWRDGRLLDLTRRLGFFQEDRGLRQQLYVDPRSGLVRLNKDYTSGRRRAAERRKREQAEIDSRRRTVDEQTQLHRLDGVWFRVEIASLPETVRIDRIVNGERRRKRTAESRFDVVLRRSTSRLAESREERSKLYGSKDLYAAAKRQLSKQELKQFGLR